jgi:hypothetical protein
MLNSSLEFTEGSSSKEKLTVTRALAVATRWLPARAGFNYVFKNSEMSILASRRTARSVPSAISRAWWGRVTLRPVTACRQIS